MSSHKWDPWIKTPISDSRVCSLCRCQHFVVHNAGYYFEYWRAYRHRSRSSDPGCDAARMNRIREKVIKASKERYARKSC